MKAAFLQSSLLVLVLSDEACGVLVCVEDRHISALRRVL